MINRISRIYQDREARNRPPIPESSTPQYEDVEPEVEQKNEFVPAEKQRHFGILHYTMNNRFRKIILIGVVNVLLLVAFFLFMFFFVVRVKCEDRSVSTTVHPKTTRAASGDGPTTPAASLVYTCTNEFKLVYEKCWLERIDLPHRQGAEQICNSLGAILMTIKSAEENQAFLSWMADRHHSVWMGLTCGNGDKENCIWDDLQKYPFDYEAFQDGSPSGPCLEYNISGHNLGKEWYSVACDKPTSYVCEQPRTIEAACTHNFNMHCYHYHRDAKTFPEAQDVCRSQCGNLLVIESIRENIYIQSISEIQTDWIFLGGFATSRDYIIWLDGSPMEWNNVQEYDEKQSCLLLRMGTQGGGWDTTDCSGSAPFVCKVPIGKEC